jgi:hypothetical protein
VAAPRCAGVVSFVVIGLTPLLRQDDPALPEGLRGRAHFPCVVTNDLSRLGETLTLLRLAELWGAASLSRHAEGARA